MNNYRNDRVAIDRLKDEYIKHNKLIIGFDFDSTIYDYHKKGLELQSTINLLLRCQSLNFVMCLWTLTPNGAPLSLLEKMKYCNNIKLKPNYVNNSPVLIDQDTVGLNKPFFSILLDDRAGLSAAFNILETTLNELNL